MLDVEPDRHAVGIEADGNGHDWVGCDMLAQNLGGRRSEAAYKLERRFVGLHRGRRRRGVHREIVACRLWLGVMRRRYRSHGIVSACVRGLSSRLET